MRSFYKDLLKMLKKKDGEMMLAGDWTQDIYGKGKRWNLDAMKSAGLSTSVTAALSG